MKSTDRRFVSDTSGLGLVKPQYLPTKPQKIWCKQYNSAQLNSFTIRKEGLTVKTEYHIKIAKDTEVMKMTTEKTPN